MINGKSKSLNALKAFNVTIEHKQEKRIKCANSNKYGEYFGRYDETRRNHGLFAKYLQEYRIKAGYTMFEALEQDGIAKRRSQTLTYMVRCMLIHSYLLEFLQGCFENNYMHHEL